MKITNRYNLPEAFVELASKNQYQTKSDRFGATTLLLPAQEIVLRQRYQNEMSQDISDMINLFIGTAVHDLLERHDKGEYVELYLKHEILDGYYVSGKIDKFDRLNMEVVDYKTARVSKIVYNDFRDWRMQGLIYAWLLLKNGYYADKIRFIALLKDWSHLAKYTKNNNDDYYPESAVYIYEQKVYADDLTKIETYILKKVEQIVAMRDMSTEDILKIPLEKDYAPIIKYAVYATPDSPRAKRLFSDEESAEKYKEKHGGVVIERADPNPKYEMSCTAMQYAKKIKEDI